MNLGCAVISPMEKIVIPSMKTQIPVEMARIPMPSVPRPIPTTIVGSARVFLTRLDTTSCSRMIVPALITVTCSTSNRKLMELTPMKRSAPLTAALRLEAST